MTSMEVTGTPTFRDFRVEFAPVLIAAMHRGGDDAAPAYVWCERLMRYCEIFRSDLERRARAKWTTRAAARTGLMAISWVLAEATMASGDARFVNTALKLLELAFDAKIFRRNDADAIAAASHAARATDLALRQLEPRFEQSEPQPDA